jgi:hypothetical protein
MSLAVSTPLLQRDLEFETHPIACRCHDHSDAFTSYRLVIGHLSIISLVHQVGVEGDKTFDHYTKQRVYGDVSEAYVSNSETTSCQLGIEV